MAIIDLLIKSNMVRNVLFIADRVALVRQAKDNGFVFSGTANTKDSGEDFLLVKVNDASAISGLSTTELIGLGALVASLLIVILVLVKRKSWQGRREQV